MRFWIGVGVFIGVVLIAFALFVLHIAESPAPDSAPAPSVAPITNIRIKDSYKSGINTITGLATVPTACTALNATSTVLVAGDASTTPVIRVDLSAPIDTGMCLQLLTDVSFSLSANAGAGAEIDTYANGEAASTTAL